MAFQNNYWQKTNEGLQEHHKVAAHFIQPTDSVLDIGCGDGTFLDFITCKEKLGCDISVVAIDKCKEKGITAFQWDIEEAFFEGHENYDVVTVLAFLEHCLEPEKVLKQASLIGKKIIVAVPNMAFFVERLRCFFGLVPKELSPRKGHCYYFTKKVLEKMIESCDLRIVRRKHYFFPKNLHGFFPSLFATFFVYVCERNDKN